MIKTIFDYLSPDLFYNLELPIGGVLISVLFFSIFITVFIGVIILSMYFPTNPEEPMSGVRCPDCAKRGIETWVIPGKNCHICGCHC